MGEAGRNMEAQLVLWGQKIDDLAAQTHRAGAQARFDAHMYIDELKALHAIAQSKFDELRAAADTERARIERELKRACNELEAALKRPKPPA